MSIDSVRDVIMTFPRTYISVNLSVSIMYADTNGRKMSSVNFYEKKTNGKYINASHENVVNLKTSDYLIIEFNKKSPNKEDALYESVSISYPHFFQFIKGIDETSKLLREVISTDEDGIPFIGFENKDRSVLIDKLANDKCLQFTPHVQDDGVEVTAGVLLFVNDTNCYSFIDLESFFSFSYIMKKFDLYSASRILLGTAASLAKLQGPKEPSAAPSSMGVKRSVRKT